MKIYMDEMTSKEFGDWVADDKVVIFPIGALAGTNDICFSDNSEFHDR